MATRCFAKLMWKGKVSVALKMLSKDYDNGVFKFDEKVLEELKLKDPVPVEVKEDSLLHGPIKKVPSCYFNDIDEKALLLHHR